MWVVALILIVSVLVLILVRMHAKPRTIEEMARHEADRYNPSVKANKDDIIEITVQDGKVWISVKTENQFWERKQNEVLKFIEQAVGLHQEISGTFIVGLHDIYESDLGIMVFAKTHLNQANCCIPDEYAMTGYTVNFYEKSGKADRIDGHEFKDKIQKAIFSGASSGERIPEFNTRIRLCDWAQDHSDIRCNISNMVQMEQADIERVYPHWRSFTGGYINETEQLN